MTLFRRSEHFKTNDFPRLEVLHHAAKKDIGASPLLLVHGAFAGAWCWEKSFLPWFAEMGFDVFAVSLRGHGESDGAEDLDHFGIDDYVEDLERVVDMLPSEPVIIGHSMGGFVAQKYIQTRGAKGLVLMASVPPTGMMGPAMSLAISKPSLLWQLGVVQACGMQHMTMDAVHAALFSDAVPLDLVSEYMPKFQNESSRACMDMYGLSLPFVAPLTGVPVKVLGAGKDLLVSTPHIHATAAMFGVVADIFYEMGHGMMLEPGWEDVASSILDWLEESGLAPKV